MIPELIELVDSQLLLLANGTHTAWADHFMMMFSGRFIWIPMYVALAFIVMRQYELRKAIAVLVGVGLAIALADQVCATFIRPFVGRLRPSNPDNPLSAFITVVDGYRGGSYGFPSCHAANSFALIAYMTLLVPRRRMTFFLLCWGVVNSYSRLYLGVHYPGDLLAGAVIGGMCGAAVAIAVRRVIGMPMPRPGNIDILGREASRLRLLPAAGVLSVTGGLSLRVSDMAIAVGLTTVLVMAAVAA